jgi:hypothetical protein
MKPFNKSKCLQRLNIKQVPFDALSAGVPYNSHGYAISELRVFAINPKCPFPGAAGFHELAHIVLEHHLTPNDTAYHEMEVSAVTIKILKTLGMTNGLKEAYQHYYDNLVPRQSDFEQRVNDTRRVILEAGKDS